MTAALTLFDVAALAPTSSTVCRWCGNRATIRVHSARNLLGTIPVWLAPTWYRDATRRANSGPCCDTCAWTFANAWWNPTRSCPRGGCTLWAHTLANPQPECDCRRCHYERAIVWREPLEAIR